jgi:aryl-alcohol dehydrogenase-like predicted oxidoreductase
MITRRDCLKYSVLTAAAAALPPQLTRAALPEGRIFRAIPKTGERLPIVGLGSSATFRKMADSGEVSPLSEVLSTFFDNGGTVFDTAPAYGASEEVSGRLIRELGAIEKVFWATKLNVAPRGGGAADPEAARAQIERSFKHSGKDPIDLVQVHQLRDVPTQLAILKDLREAGRLRYIGVTYTGDQLYPDLAQVMREEPIDFIGGDYAVDNRKAADVILPLAIERGIGVLVYLPFGRTRLWARVAGLDLPSWAADFGAESWAQFFLKFAAAHPAVTSVTPSTSKAEHVLDNLGAGVGELPDEAMQKRMADFVDALPAA